MVVTVDILVTISRAPYTFLMLGTHTQVFMGVCVCVCVCVDAHSDIDLEN